MTQVLCLGPLRPQLLDQLDSRYDTAVLADLSQTSREPISPPGTAAHKCTVVVTSGRTGVPGWLMDRLPNLRAIINFGVGYDAIDLVAARQRDIHVANTPDVLTECVADIAVGLIISTMRSLPAADKFLRAGHWADGTSFPLATKVSGKRFGILGLGRIGRAAAARLEGFSNAINYHNRNRLDDVAYTYYSTPAALAGASDVLLVTAAGGSASRGLVDQQVLRSLGPAGFLINVGRGSVVDEQALVTALDAGEIAGAGLDTFVDEPHVPTALMKREDVVLLPHIASGTEETRAAMSELVVKNVDRFFTTGELLTPVAP